MGRRAAVDERQGDLFVGLDAEESARAARLEQIARLTSQANAARLKGWSLAELERLLVYLRHEVGHEVNHEVSRGGTPR